MILLFFASTTESLSAKEHHHGIRNDAPERTKIFNDVRLEKPDLQKTVMPAFTDPVSPVKKDSVESEATAEPDSVIQSRRTSPLIGLESVLNPNYVKTPSLNQKIKIVKKLLQLKKDVKPDQDKKRTNGSSVVGIVFGCLGFLLCWVPVIGLLFSLIGVIFSGIGLSRTRKDPNLRGRTVATIGLVFGIIGLVLAVIITTILLIALAVATK